MDKVFIRQGVFDDADQIIKLLDQLDNETDFMLYEAEERKNQKDIQIKINKILTGQSNQVIFLAANTENKLIAIIMGLSGQVNRQKHTLHIVIGVLQNFCSQGIGKQLMQLLERWAIDNQFHRLQLTVMVHNEIAIQLYKKCGFQIEGIKRDSIMLNGQYIDELYMSKLV